MANSGETRSAFVDVLIHMVRNSDIILLGRHHGTEFEAIPSTHFDTHSVSSMPSLETGLMIFKTFQGSDFPAAMRDDGGYDRVHVTSDALAAIQTILSRVERLTAAKHEPAETGAP